MTSMCDKQANKTTHGHKGPRPPMMVRYEPGTSRFACDVVSRNVEHATSARGRITRDGILGGPTTGEHIVERR